MTLRYGFTGCPPERSAIFLSSTLVVLSLQSHECVRTVTDCLERMGIAGHQTTAGAERQVELAKSIMTSIQNKVKSTLLTLRTFGPLETCIS